MTSIQQHPPANSNPLKRRHHRSRRLEGKFFHSFEDGHFQWQGYIISQPSPGYYLVQFFEWFMGEPSTQKVVHIGRMTDWNFYCSAGEMRDEYHREKETVQ